MKKSTESKCQAEEVTYELHSLGWKQFQNLCLTIISEIWGQIVQGFFDSNDGGRDGAFYGKWKKQNGEILDGTFTIQCKFTGKRDKQLKLSDLHDELKKAKRLVQRGLADNYFIFTNNHLTGLNDEKISSAFYSIPGLQRFAIYGSERISQFIRESNRLRMLVPQIYGLGDLSTILDERAYAQSKEILSAFRGELQKFVITDAFKKSTKALVEHGFVLLLGEPACGKSIIAAALAIGALDVWGCSTLNIKDASEFTEHYNPHELKQFFWVDDAFGSTQPDVSKVLAWNSAFPYMNSAIAKGARIIFTSRDYIYKIARQFLKESAFPLIRDSQVIIHVEKLSKEEREQILYNHIRLGLQPKKIRSQFKPLLPNVASNEHFTPEIARRLGNPTFTKEISISEYGLIDFVENPLDMLFDTIEKLDKENRSALALIFMRGGELLSPIDISKEEQYAINLLGGSLSGVRNSLNALDGSLIIKILKDNKYVWRYKHPTIHDAFGKLISEDIELMDIYLRGTPLDKLFKEVSCGDVGIEGIKAIIPSDRFDSLLNRIEAYYDIPSDQFRLYELYDFLSSRCCRDFLLSCTSRFPEIISSLQVGSYLYADRNVSLIERLHEFGILPESIRLRAVETIRKLAIDTPDSGFLLERIRKIMTQQEVSEILEYVRKSLVPCLNDVIDNWLSNYPEDEDPEGYFYELQSTLQDYRDEFIEYEDSTELIEEALSKIDNEIQDLLISFHQKPEKNDFIGEGSIPENKSASRSIFDDVDL